MLPGCRIIPIKSIGKLYFHVSGAGAGLPGIAAGTDQPGRWQRGPAVEAVAADQPGGGEGGRPPAVAAGADQPGAAKGRWAPASGGGCGRRFRPRSGAQWPPARPRIFRVLCRLRIGRMALSPLSIATMGKVWCQSWNGRPWMRGGRRWQPGRAGKPVVPTRIVSESPGTSRVGPALFFSLSMAIMMRP
jgi:hypothetical protein